VAFVDLGGSERQQDAPLAERQPKCSTSRRRSYLFSFSPDIPSSSANPTRGPSLVGMSPFGANLKGVAARIDPSDSCAARPLSGSRQGPGVGIRAMNGWRELLTRGTARERDEVARRPRLSAPQRSRATRLTLRHAPRALARRRGSVRPRREAASRRDVRACPAFAAQPPVGRRRPSRASRSGRGGGGVAVAERLGAVSELVRPRVERVLAEEQVNLASGQGHERAGNPARSEALSDSRPDPEPRSPAFETSLG
jgi:hypothetical protein